VLNVAWFLLTVTGASVLLGLSAEASGSNGLAFTVGAIGLFAYAGAQLLTWDE
jgi:hypothetical protein